MYFENRESATPTVVKNASTAPSGRSSLVSDAASTWADARSRKSKKFQHRMPSTDASWCFKRVLR